MNMNCYNTNTASQPNKTIDSERDSMRGDSINANNVSKGPSSQNEPYLRNHPVENSSSNERKEEEEDYTKGEIVAENHDVIISMLFQDAIYKLGKIDVSVKQQKKQIVVELAKNLEEKIPTDTICMEIVNQLRGQVSERFVRECLDEKYKQKLRVDNARKQKKQYCLKDKDEFEKLAAVTPLNQESVNDKIILVGAHGGQELVQSEGEKYDKPFSDVDADSTEDNTISLSPKLSHQKEHEQQLGPKNEPVDLKECPSCIELSYKNNELREAIGKLNQFTSADKMKNANDANNDVKTTNKILDFEFCKPYGELSEYLGSFPQISSSADVWFNGTIDTSTRKVVSSGYGRIRQQSESEPLASEIIDDDDWEEVDDESFEPK